MKRACPQKVDLRSHDAANVDDDHTRRISCASGADILQRHREGGGVGVHETHASAGEDDGQCGRGERVVRDEDLFAADVQRAKHPFERAAPRTHSNGVSGSDIRRPLPLELADILAQCEHPG